MDKLINNPKFQAWASATTLAVGYKLFTYEVGGTTKKTTYTTRALSVANSNPIVLDSRGETTGVFCTGTIKLVLCLPTETDPPTGSPIWTMDNLKASFIAALSDDDSDTLVQVEETTDEDKIRFDTNGTQRALIDSDGLTLASGA
jgi:hypothetical protein